MTCDATPYIFTGDVQPNEQQDAIDLRTPNRLGHVATGGYVENTGFNPLTVVFFAPDNTERELKLLPGQERSTPWAFQIVQFRGGAAGASSFRLVVR